MENLQVYPYRTCTFQRNQIESLDHNEWSVLVMPRLEHDTRMMVTLSKRENIHLIQLSLSWIYWILLTLFLWFKLGPQIISTTISHTVGLVVQIDLSNSDNKWLLGRNSVFAMPWNKFSVNILIFQNHVWVTTIA